MKGKEKKRCCDNCEYMAKDNNTKIMFCVCDEILTSIFKFHLNNEKPCEHHRFRNEINETI